MPTTKEHCVLKIKKKKTLRAYGTKNADWQRLCGRRKPDLVIVMIGTNDTGHELKGTLESCTKTLKQIFSLKLVLGIGIIPKNCGWTLQRRIIQQGIKKL